MKFSTSIEYAVHALVFLSRAAPGATVLLAELARGITVPEGYLRKVSQQLARRGLVVAQRGVRGGVALARKADRITLRDVVDAIDGSLPSWSCLRTQRGYRVANPCPVKEAFDKATASMARELDGVTIADIAGKLGRKSARWLPVGECA